jgi:hypothetical protein
MIAIDGPFLHPMGLAAILTTKLIGKLRDMHILLLLV